MAFLLQLAKMGALAALAALTAVHWLSQLDASIVGVGALYLLVLRVS